jgi:membrane-associated phospholipid phosphatase
MTVLAPARSRTYTVHLPVAGWAAVGFVLLYLLSVGTAIGQQLDESAMRWTAETFFRNGWAQGLLTAVSAWGVLLSGAALATVTAVTRGPRVAVLGGLSVVVVLLGAEVLKLALTRPALSTGALANSFPSGHVAAVTGLAVALVLAAPAGGRRRAALVGVTPVVTLTGLATVVLEWHRPSDVLGSVLLGVMVGMAAVRWEHGPRPAAADEQSEPAGRDRVGC